MRLLRVELARLRSRRAFAALAAAAVLGPLLFGWAAFATASPLSESERLQAEQGYELARADWEENGQEYVEQCRQEEAAETERTGTAVDYGCDDMEPRPEWYLVEPPRFTDYLRGNVAQALLLLGLITVALGISAVAAEFGTGSMGGWLTFEPRRGRVLASKLGAVAVAGLVLGAVYSALVVAATAAGFRFAGVAAVVTGDDVAVAARMALIGVVAAGVGGALAFVVRHTAAALGVTAAVVIGLDGVLLGGVLQLQRWQLSTNAAAVVLDGNAYYTQTCTTDATGTSCTSTEHLLTLADGALYLGVLALAAVVVAVLTFRRRDVA